MAPFSRQNAFARVAVFAPSHESAARGGAHASVAGAGEGVDIKRWELEAGTGHRQWIVGRHLRRLVEVTLCRLLGRTLELAELPHRLAEAAVQRVF